MANTAEPEPFIRIGEASKLLQVSVATAREWADRGKIPHHRTPLGQRRFLRSELEPLIKNGSAA